MKITDYRRSTIGTILGTAGNSTAIGGVSVTSGAPTVGQIIVATSSNTFTWQNPTAVSSNYLLRTEGGLDVIKAHGSMGATETFDPTDGNVHTGTLDADCTFTLNAPQGTGASTLAFWITQDGTGGWDITWPGSVTWSGGAPTPDTTAGVTVVYLLESIDGGTSWVGYLAGSGGSSFALSHPSVSSNSFSSNVVLTNDASVAITMPQYGTLHFSAPFFNEVVTNGEDVLVWHGADLVHDLVRLY